MDGDLSDGELSDGAMSRAGCKGSDTGASPVADGIHRQLVSRKGGRYERPRLIGRGGMKVVYRVYDTRTTRHVALARPLTRHDAEHFDTVLREAHLTARLEHPGIITLYDIDVDDDGRPFFTMEFKRGRSLRECLRCWRRDADPFRIDAGRPTVRSRLEMFLKIGEAIAYAHRRGVLHLDIKPENVQVGHGGEPKVCDWGLGVVVTDGDRWPNE